jgi:hypothetical protein
MVARGKTPDGLGGDLDPAHSAKVPALVRVVSERWIGLEGTLVQALFIRESPEHTAEYTTDDLINAVFSRHDPPSQRPAVEPPSIASAAPVMKRACDEAK